MKRVLLLDKAYQPLDVVGWREAMELLVTGKAEVVEEYEDTWIRSPSRKWRLPSILRKLSRMKWRKRTVVFSRQNIFFRDNWTCQYCGDKKKVGDLTFDHVKPQCRGGKTNWENVVAACWPCNQKKANFLPQEVGMRLLRTPVKPKIVPTVVIRLKESDPQSWRDYLYWNTELVPG